MTWHTFTDGVLTLQLYVQPGGKTDRIDGIHADRLKIRIRAPAIEGRANNYLINFLADHFAVPKAKVEITRGRQGRKKTVRIIGLLAWPDWFTQLNGPPAP